MLALECQHRGSFAIVAAVSRAVRYTLAFEISNSVMEIIRIGASDAKATHGPATHRGDRWETTKIFAVGS